MPESHQLHTQDSFRRRDFLRIGSGIVASGFPFSFGCSAFTAASAAEPTSSIVRLSSPAKSCIVVYLLGGPPHLDTFDLKPQAPVDIRGKFKPIATCVPGLQICEHLPRLAGIADRYSLVRSVSHPDSRHTPMIYYTLTGRHSPNARENDVRPPQRTDDPHLGSVLAKLKTTAPAVPGFVALPELAIRSSTEGEFQRARSPLRGGRAGFLGPKYDPLTLNGAPGEADEGTPLILPRDVSSDRFQNRLALLNLLNGRWSKNPLLDDFREMRRTAVVLTGSANEDRKSLLSLDDVPDQVHDRYGRHRFGQSMLLARRLAEIEVPLIAIHFNNMTLCDGWDTHSKNFEACEQELLPLLDQSLSALLEDLDRTGKLDETLVVCMGEFGRTPKINKNAGRDHWGPCSSALLAGGGIQGGRVWGASDKHGAYPIDDPVDPVDIHATIYHSMGFNPTAEITDHLDRPFRISHGRVLQELL